MKVRQVIKIIERDGWYHARSSGSHRQFKHPTKNGLVTVAKRPGYELSIGVLCKIWRQAGLKQQMRDRSFSVRRRQDCLLAAALFY